MINTNDTVLPKLVIIGAGFAGIELTKHLKNAPVDITLLDRHNYHTFQPLLYQVATGALEVETIAFPIRRIFHDQKNAHFSMANVLRINADSNSVETSVGTFQYDYLVLATGATTNFFNDKQLEHFAMGMKSVPEALSLRSMILQNLEAAVYEKDPGELEELMTFVLVGGGPTGVELAGALSELKNHILERDYPTLSKRMMRVFLIESKPRVLGVMSEEASAKAKEYLEQMGVTIYNGVRVKSYDGELLTINDGRTIRTRNVLWAAGVTGEFPEGMPEDKIGGGRRIIVDEFNRVKGYQNVFSIGDVSATITETLPNGYPGVAQVAIQQGKHLAKNLKALVEGKEMEPFAYNDKGSLATIGKNRAVADLGRFKTQGFFAWLIWCFVHLLSLVGFKNRIVVFLAWVARYFSNNSTNRLIIRPFNRTIMKEEPAAK
jgi:NADH dehydrogenase